MLDHALSTQSSCSACTHATSVRAVVVFLLKPRQLGERASPHSDHTNRCTTNHTHHLPRTTTLSSDPPLFWGFQPSRSTREAAWAAPDAHTHALHRHNALTITAPCTRRSCVASTEQRDRPHHATPARAPGPARRTVVCSRCHHRRVCCPTSYDHVVHTARKRRGLLLWRTRRGCELSALERHTQLRCGLVLSCDRDFSPTRVVHGCERSCVGVGSLDSPHHSDECTLSAVRARWWT